MPDLSRAESFDPAVVAARRAGEEGQLSAEGAAHLIRWLLEGQYAAYRERLVAMIERCEWSELDRLFWEVIPFGTGGRRGPMAEFGAATINDRTIAESAQGLADYLGRQKLNHPGRGVVAFDTRHRSEEFARLTAQTLAANGITVFLFDGARATPELSFAVRHLACDVGVMISASHNPPSDNGFKAYWSNGGQVLPPHDRGIIECVYAVKVIPTIDFDEAVAAGKIVRIGAAIDRAYVDAVVGLSLSDARDIAAVYTPLHGVGETSIVRVLEQAGFTGVSIFEPQRTPDGSFSNVPDQLPNPERPEVFTPAVRQAQQSGADLVLASDPDADRLGVAVRGRNGAFVILSGNRVAALLVDYVLRKRAVAGTLTPAHYVVTTLVTTPQFAAIALSFGVRVVDNLLVGFKYIADAMDREGPERFVFGAEESLGYLAGEYCRDKDAAVAALFLMELAAELRQERRTLLDRLDELFLARGYFAESQRSETCPGPRGREQIQAIMRALRASPPAQLAGIKLSRARDYARHEIRSIPENRFVSTLEQPEGDLLMLDSAEGPSRFTIAARPSGTEPKIKFYFLAQAECRGAADLERVKTETDRALVEIADALSAWVHERVEGH